MWPISVHHLINPKTSTLLRREQRVFWNTPNTYSSLTVNKRTFTAATAKTQTKYPRSTVRALIRGDFLAAGFSVVAWPSWHNVLTNDNGLKSLFDDRLYCKLLSKTSYIFHSFLTQRGNWMESYAGVVTVRLIKSFEYRNFRNLIVKNVDLKQTVAEFKRRIDEGVIRN